MFKFRYSLFILLLTFGCGSKEEAKSPSTPAAAEVEKAVQTPAKPEKAQAKPSPSGFVIVKDMEAVVGKMLELNRSSAAESWDLESAQISDNHIKVLYKSADREVKLELHHPKQTKAQFEVIGPFAVVGALPQDLKDVFVKRIEDQAKNFSWKYVVSKTEGVGEGEDKDSPQKSNRPKEANAQERHQAEAPFQLTESGRAIESQLNELFKKAWAGNAPEWEEEVTKIMAPNEVHPTLLYRIATSVRDLKSPADARPIYERILKSLAALEAKLGLALPVRLELSRASAFLGVEDTKSAVRSLDKALEIGASDSNWNPCQVPHYMMSAVGMADQKILHDWLDRFIVAQPDCRLAYRIKVDDFAARGNKDKAIELLWDLDKKGKAELSDFYRVAELLVENEQNDKAVDVYRRICASLECTAHTRGNLVWAQSSFHRDPIVIKRYVKEAEDNHDNSLRQFEVGVMLHYARRYKESLPFLIRASKLWPDDPRILLYTAMNYYRSGQQEKAEVAIEHAVTNASQRDPDLYYCRSVIFRNSNLAKGLENLERYRTLSSRGDVPPQKKKMVDDFIQAMKDELKRRANGAEARPFADPEEDFFGEPPGSPGHAENAIHIPH